MKAIKKSSYFFVVIFILMLITLFYSLFFNSHQQATPDHTSVTLTPFTAREQKDLIKAEEQADQLDVTGPLVATMNASDAQAKVLNLNMQQRR